MVSVCRGLAAQQQFEQTAPKWARTIGLPLREDECEALLKDPDNRIRLLGQYALARRLLNWQAGTYPPFDEAYLQQRADNGSSCRRRT